MFTYLGEEYKIHKKDGIRNVVNKVKLQYNTCMTVAGCGQVDSGISDDFESEGNIGLVNFQQSVCCNCEVHVGL